MSTVQFAVGGDTATIPGPAFGYTAEVRMRIDAQQRSDGSYGLYDHGSSYDTRVCLGARFTLTAAQMADMNTIFSDTTKGRGSDVSLTLGSSGWRPFGPGFGSTNDPYTVRVIRYKQSGLKHKPWKYYQLEMDLVMGGTPSPGWMVDRREGNMRIGTVNGLQYPQEGFAPLAHYAVDHVVTHDGTTYETDLGTGADYRETEFSVRGNEDLCCAAVQYLVGTARANQFTIGTYGNPWGQDATAQGSFDVYSITPTIAITHEAYDRFSFPLRLYKV